MKLYLLYLLTHTKYTNQHDYILTLPTYLPTYLPISVCQERAGLEPPVRVSRKSHVKTAAAAAAACADTGSDSGGGGTLLLEG